MIDHRGEGRGSIITGSSVHNSRVERAHRDIYSRVLAFYARIFEAMEDEGILDILDNVHLYSLHLDEFIHQMSNHPVSSVKQPVTLTNVGKGYVGQHAFWQHSTVTSRN